MKGTERMASESLRTLAFAFKCIDLSTVDTEHCDSSGVYVHEKSGFTFLGVFGIGDVVLPGVQRSI